MGKITRVAKHQEFHFQLLSNGSESYFMPANTAEESGLNHGRACVVPIWAAELVVDRVAFCQSFGAEVAVSGDLGTELYGLFLALQDAKLGRKSAAKVEAVEGAVEVWRRLASAKRQASLLERLNGNRAALVCRYGLFDVAA